MKKGRTVFILSLFVFFLGGCGSKKETATYTQAYKEGITASVTIEHTGDKVTDTSAKIIFNNEALKITDEEIAKSAATAFEATSLFNPSSNSETGQMTYSDKETVVTYRVPSELVDTSNRFSATEKKLTAAGFKKE